jgi:dolichol-phosphate mannosyltransferase
MRIAVVIPAYNEAGNIGRLVEETIAAVPESVLQAPMRRSRRCSGGTRRCVISSMAGAPAKAPRFVPV